MMEWVMDGRMDCKDGSDEGNSEYIIGFHVLLEIFPSLLVLICHFSQRKFVSFQVSFV